MDETWKVYIVKCSTGELYTGCTTDIERRLAQHNRGVASKFTRSRRPVTLVYEEGRFGRSEALRREYQIKHMSREGKMALLRRLRPPVRRQGSRR